MKKLLADWASTNFLNAARATLNRFCVPLLPKPQHIGRGEYSLSPDGQRVAFVSIYHGKNQIFLKKLNSQEPASLLFEHPEGAGEPCFSPDGQSLAFTSQENGVSQVFVDT
ncbi:MAG: hypothetical protein PSV24_07265, partial [Rhodoferax sp.]|nr:hypothetical protein [Rhodoferax sp.]